MNINPAILLMNFMGAVSAEKELTEKTVTMAERICTGVLAVELRQSVECAGFLNTELSIWRSDLGMFISEGIRAMGYRDRFFRKIAAPLLSAHEALSDTENPGRKDAALAKVAPMAESVWKFAMTQFINQQPEKKDERP